MKDLDNLVEDIYDVIYNEKRKRAKSKNSSDDKKSSLKTRIKNDIPTERKRKIMRISIHDNPQLTPDQQSSLKALMKNFAHLLKDKTNPVFSQK